MTYFWKQMLGVYILLSLVVGFAVTVDTAIDFGRAYPDKQLDVTIKMNDFGEYWVEVCLMAFALPGIVISFLQQIKKLDQMKNHNQNQR